MGIEGGRTLKLRGSTNYFVAVRARGKAKKGGNYHGLRRKCNVSNIINFVRTRFEDGSQHGYASGKSD